MKVKLINSTIDPEFILQYTKETRLGFGEETRAKILARTPEEVDKELEYIADTIPSSWEFIDFIFEISDVSRAFTHQFVRTRTNSYAQQTMRLLPMENFGYVTGPSILEEPKRKDAYDYCMYVIQETYNTLLALGAKAEDARGILPTNICTNIIAKINLRTFVDLTKTRTGGRTQGEYQEVMKAAKEEVLRALPWTDKFIAKPIASDISRLEAMFEQMCKDGKIDDAYRLKGLKVVDQIKRKLT